MIVFAQLRGELTIYTVNTDLGSETELPIVHTNSGDVLQAFTYDPFKLKQSVARPRKRGMVHSDHNVQHTDSTGSVVIGAPSDFHIFADEHSRVIGYLYHGFYLFDPMVNSDVSMPMSNGVYTCGVRVESFKEEGETIHLISVRTVFRYDNSIWYDGQTYFMKFTASGRFYVSDVRPPVHSQTIPPVPLPETGLTSSYHEVSGLYSVTVYPTEDEQPLTLREIFESTKLYLDYPLIPEFDIQDNDIFYKALDNITPDTTNWGEFYEGLVDISPSLEGLLTGAGELTETRHAGRRTVSYLAGAYLFYLYALKPMPDDLAIVSQLESTLRDYSARNAPSIATRQTYRKEGWTGRQALQVTLKPSFSDRISQVDEFLDSIPDGELRVGSATIPCAREGAQEMLNRLSAAGIPTDRYHAMRFVLDNVRLSFAANWFLGFNDKLDDLHRGVVWRRMPVDYYCRSIKATKDRSEGLGQILKQLGVKASYSLITKVYKRLYGFEIPDLPLSENNPDLVRVWDQAAALFLVRLA